MKNAIVAAMIAAGLALAGCKSGDEGTGGAGQDKGEGFQREKSDYPNADGRTSPHEAQSEDPVLNQPEGTGGADVEGGAPGEIEEQPELQGEGVEEGETQMQNESGAQPQ